MKPPGVTVDLEVQVYTETEESNAKPYLLR